MRALVMAMLLWGAAGVAMAADKIETANDVTFEAIEGGQLPLSRFQGKVLLVVNTASFCGYTSQYEGLQGLWEKYEKAGLVVIGVPSNDFGGQEPKSEAEIQSFCKGAYNVTFPMTAKAVVAGKAAHPFYLWARSSLGDVQAPRWNFHKYLIGRDGRLLKGFPTALSPASKEVVGAIEAALAQK